MWCGCAVRPRVSETRRVAHFMSDMKYDAVTSSGIKIVERCDIPEELIPADAKVEIDAKVYAGYYAGSKEKKTLEQLAFTVGRNSDFNNSEDARAAK